MQRYRSGHNGADSKSVCRQLHVGSNPTRCATSEQSPLCSGIFLQKCHPLRSVPLPLLSKLEPLRSRWRLRRLTDAAYPLRVLRWVAVWFLVQT